MYKITLKLQQMRNLKHMAQKRLAFLANISQGHPIGGICSQFYSFLIR
ncbi:MAG: hypothetical protein ACREVX_13820 [Clostridium sp.]